MQQQKHMPGFLLVGSILPVLPLLSLLQDFPNSCPSALHPCLFERSKHLIDGLLIYAGVGIQECLDTFFDASVLPIGTVSALSVRSLSALSVRCGQQPNT